MKKMRNKANNQLHDWDYSTDSTFCQVYNHQLNNRQDCVTRACNPFSILPLGSNLAPEYASLKAELEGAFQYPTSRIEPCTDLPPISIPGVMLVGLLTQPQELEAGNQAHCVGGTDYIPDAS